MNASVSAGDFESLTHGSHSRRCARFASTAAYNSSAWCGSSRRRVRSSSMRWENMGERCELGVARDCHPERTREGSGLVLQGQILREYAQDDDRAALTPLALAG